jgi:DNA-directed RNA polymerase subunit H (RpoH/RPB5)
METTVVHNALVNLRLMVGRRGYKAAKGWSVDDNKYIALSPMGKVYIFMCKDNKLKIDCVKSFLAAANGRVNHIIIVYNNSITAATKSLIAMAQLSVELFLFSELQYDITKHNLFAPHVKVVDEKLSDYRKDNAKNLPKLLQTDIVCRYYFFKRGDMIKINRRDGTMVYKIVV